MKLFWILIILIIIYFFYYFNKETFDNIKINNKELTIYNFNTRWCGYSTSFQPEWNEFTDKMRKEYPNVKVLDIKCDDPINTNMCNSNNIPGFPHIRFEYDGKQETYKSQRKVNALMDKVKNIMN